jgi:hypothetical protein
MIIENEERFLALARGEAYAPAELAGLSLDELRVKAWHELEWFLQPAEGVGDLLLYPDRPRAGESGQSLFDCALRGGQLSPLDDAGAPLIRTCGSEDPDCFGYNDPPAAAAIAAALEVVDPQSWPALLPRRAELLRQAAAELSESEAAEIAADELQFAEDAFAVLRHAYRDATARRFGVACEYSM